MGEGLKLDWSEIIQSIIVFTAGAGFTLFLRWSTARATKQKDFVERLTSVESELANVQTKLDPLWKVVQSSIAKDLTHPSPQFKRADELLRKLLALTITDQERIELRKVLTERSFSKDAEVKDTERLKAKVMLDVMDLVLIEAASGKPLEYALIEKEAR